jgi:hypothetical protein
LKYINLDHCGLEEEALKLVCDCIDLEYLKIDCPNVDTRDFNRVAQLRNLRSLVSFCSLVNDSFADALSNLKYLERLELCGGCLTDAFLSKISTCLPNLKSLNFSMNREITDSGMGFLVQLPFLERLNLSGCSITANGLDTLNGKKRLSSFFLY